MTSNTDEIKNMKSVLILTTVQTHKDQAEGPSSYSMYELFASIFCQRFQHELIGNKFGIRRKISTVN